VTRERRVRVGHRLEAVLVAGIGAAIRILPEGIALSLGRLLGWSAGVLLRIRHRVVLENLTRAFPEAPDTWRRRTAAAAFSHIGREGVALLRLAGLGHREVWERTEVEGLDAIREALAADRGVIVLTGHLGNWEIGGAALAVRDIPLDVVGRRQSNPLFDRRLRATRERLGMRVIYRDEGVRPILRALRESRAVALVADQNVRDGGVFVEFFGHPAATTRGPATLARRTGARVVLGTSRALPGPGARYRVTLRPLELPDTGDPDVDDRAFLQAYMTALEEAVREAPDQYFWPHRRWKTRPRDGGPEEPSPGGVGTTGEDLRILRAPGPGQDPRSPEPPLQ
jgi:Kdo2-lipid IVA lauroyltransferase/acyltransferase